MGIELLLDQDNSVLKMAAQLKLPFPVILKGSSVSIISRSDTLTAEGFGVVDTIKLERDISGLLEPGSGPKWMLSRQQLYQLGACGASATEDVEVVQAQAKAGCKLRFMLRLAFGKHQAA
jgi:hypothetical protein